MTGAADLVSILIPCHNAGRWIGSAIESALAQSYAPVEVIVVDDGSSDDSLAVIGRFGDRLRCEAGPRRGGNAARNRLLRLARGEWVQYLDADDYLLPDKLAGQAAFRRRFPQADVIYGPSLLEYWSPAATRREIRKIPPPHDPWILLARWRLPQTGAPLWRKTAIEEVGGWKEDQPCCQEHELYLRLLMAEKRFVFCPEPGAVYRQWSSQTISKRDRAEVRRRRLEIEDSVEAFLAERGMLTGERRQAINEARFEMARMAWLRARPEARRIMARIRSSDPRFRPKGAAAPAAYRVIYDMLGFSAAETLALWRRRLRGG